MDVIAPILGFMFVASFFAALLTALFGHPSRLLIVGLLVALPIPFVLAIWDPDGSCDESAFMGCFLNFSPGEWFALGAIGALLLYLGWAIGVGVGRWSRSGAGGAGA